MSQTNDFTYLDFVKLDPDNISDVPINMRTYAVCYEAVKSKVSSNLVFVPDNVLDLKLIEFAIKCNPNNKDYVTKEQLQPYEYWLKGVQDKSIPFNKVPTYHKTIEICQIAFNIDYRDIKYIPSTLITLEMAKTALSGDINLLNYIPHEIITDDFYELILKQIPKRCGDPPNLPLKPKYINETITVLSKKGYRVSTYVNNLPEKYLLPEYATYFTVQLISKLSENYPFDEMVYHCPYKFNMIPRRYLNENLILKILKRTDIFEDIPNDFKITKKIYHSYIKRYGLSLKLPHDLWDEKMNIYSCKWSHCYIKYINSDRGIKKALELNPDGIKLLTVKYAEKFLTFKLYKQAIQSVPLNKKISIVAVDKIMFSRITEDLYRDKNKKMNYKKIKDITIVFK